MLLTSRFRKDHRQQHIEQMFEFERCRKGGVAAESDDVQPNSPGLIYVATQVVEAGMDVSADRLWSEIAPWPLLLQRLGRLNRDGKADGRAQAFLFDWPAESGKGKKAKPVGPYNPEDVDRGRKLACKLKAICEKEPQLGACDALERLPKEAKDDVQQALLPKEEPFPRAIDVHGLFSTEPDLFGGFTDISKWVRGNERNADITIFWREFNSGKPLPEGDKLDGPSFGASEGCAVPVYRLRDFLNESGQMVLFWDDRTEKWEPLSPAFICPGMVVMVPRSAGGYSEKLGWTGSQSDQLEKGEVPLPGRFTDGFAPDPDTNTADWVSLEQHLFDARQAAEDIVRGLNLSEGIKKAVIAAATEHDIGKAPKQWQDALPSGKPLNDELWAKSPHLFAVKGSKTPELRENIESILKEAGISSRLVDKKPEKAHLQWLVNRKVKDTRATQPRKQIETLEPGSRVWMPQFRPGLRHEAASALAFWHRYFREEEKFPALTIYLVACH